MAFRILTAQGAWFSPVSAQEIADHLAMGADLYLANGDSLERASVSVNGDIRNPSNIRVNGTPLLSLLGIVTDYVTPPAMPSTGTGIPWWVWAGVAFLVLRRR